MKIGISEMKTNKTGTNNEKSQTCLKKKIEEHLNDEVIIIEPMINKNDIKIFNINKDMYEKNDEEILKIIIKTKF